MSKLLLGHPGLPDIDADDPRDDVIRQMQQRITDLETDLRKAESALHDNHAMRAAVNRMRNQLRPLYSSLQALFGDLNALEDGAAATPENGAQAVSPQAKAVWDNWKQRLGGSCAKVIDALLIHKNLNTQQLAVVTGMSRNTIPNLIFQMKKAGIINKAGGVFSLKQL